MPRHGGSPPVCYGSIAAGLRRLTCPFLDARADYMDDALPLIPAPYLTHVLWWFLVVWLASLGGVVGSFLNVVVYRLPRRMDVVLPRSACPVCRSGIRARHNIPVLGWLMLGGRCYDCRTPISIRYPLVELLVGALFLILAVRGPLAEGGNLPFASFRDAGRLWTLGLWLIYGYHLILLCTLLILALIEMDGDRRATRFPQVLLWMPLAIGVLAPLYDRRFHPLPWSERAADFFGGRFQLAALTEGATGVAFGLMFAAWTWAALGRGPLGRAGRWYALSGILLTGAFLGWQAVVTLTTSTTAAYLLLATASLLLPSLRRVNWTMILFALTASLIPFWKTLSGKFPILAAASPHAAFAELGVLAATAVVGSFLVAILPLSKIEIARPLPLRPIVPPSDLYRKREEEEEKLHDNEATVDSEPDALSQEAAPLATRKQPEKSHAINDPSWTSTEAPGAPADRHAHRAAKEAREPSHPPTPTTGDTANPDE